MEVVGRDPAKQSRVEATLRSIKGSKAYGNIEEKIRSGIYRRNKSVKNKNRNSLEKKKLQLSRKLERGESRQIRGNTAKLEKIGRLLSIIHEETNVENANNGGNNKYVPAEPPPEVNRENSGGIPPLPVAAEEINELPIEPLNKIEPFNKIKPLNKMESLNKDKFGTAVPTAAQPAPKKKFTIRRRLNNALNFAAAAAVMRESQTTTASHVQNVLLNNADAVASELPVWYLIPEIAPSDFVRCCLTIYAALNQEKKSKSQEDPFLKASMMGFMKMSEEDWQKAEKVRLAQKVLEMKWGDFHEELMGNFPGYKNLPQGHETGCDVMKTDGSVLIEVKNRHNTVKGSDGKHIIQMLKKHKEEGKKAIFVQVNCPKGKVNRFGAPRDMDIWNGEEAYTFLSGRETFWKDLLSTIHVVFHEYRTFNSLKAALGIA